MAFTYIQVTRTYELASDVPATGSVRFRPIDRMVNGLTVVSSPVTATLDGSGAISVRLAATTDPATRPIGVTYEVRESITGQSVVVYYVSVPHTASGGTVDLSTLSVIAPADIGAFAITAASDYDNTTPPAGGQAIVWNATASKWKPGAVAGGGGVQTVNGEFPDGTGNLVLSASDVAAQPADADLTGLGGLGDGYPQRAAGTWAALSASQLQTNLGVINQTPITLTAAGGVITPNADAGWLFRHTASANVTLANPTGGTDGQLVSVEVFASGADRVLTLPAGTSPATVTVTSGTWLQVDMRSHGGGTWIVVDYYPVSAGAGTSIPADGSVTNVKVATNAAISADKLADGTANKVMTSAERTKLAGITAGATAWDAEQTQDAAATLFTGGTHSGISFVYDDTNAKVNATVSGASVSGLTAGSATNPNGAVTGSPGDIYRNTTGGVGITLWMKESGTSTQTGWVMVRPSLYAGPAVVQPFLLEDAFTSAAPTAGNFYAVEFIADRALDAANFMFGLSTAMAGGTLFRCGLYTVDAVGAGTLVARSSGNIADAATIGIVSIPFNTTGGFPAVYTIVPSQRYALGLIRVGGTTAPVLRQKNIGVTPAVGVSVYGGRRALVDGGNTDCPTSFASNVVWSSSMFWVGLT